MTRPAGAWCRPARCGAIPTCRCMCAHSRARAALTQAVLQEKASKEAQRQAEELAASAEKRQREKDAGETRVERARGRSEEGKRTLAACWPRGGG